MHFDSQDENLREEGEALSKGDYFRGEMGHRFREYVDMLHRFKADVQKKTDQMIHD